MNAEASTLRVVIVLPLPLSIEPDDREQAGVERARVLRIALLEAGYNVVAALPGDAFLPERIGQIQPDLIVTLDLERISLGGSVFWHHREYLLPKLQAYIQGKLPALTDGCELVPAGLGDKVGDWGALALVA